MIKYKTMNNIIFDLVCGFIYYIIYISIVFSNFKIVMSRNAKYLYINLI